jgi:probable rRNA maturation factor
MNGSSQFGRQIDVSVSESYQEDLPEQWLRAAMAAALGEALPANEVFQVSLLVTSDEAVRGLNGDFRGLDEVTDVLSFSASHPGNWEGTSSPPEEHQPNHGEGTAPAFVYPPEEPTPLGEVIISYPQAQRQASERGVPVDREVALLIVHGVLHLVGHDHLEPGEEAEMQAKERAALKTVPRLRTLPQ